MSAPILFKKLATSTICGSFAAFSITQIPSAKEAAIIMFIVAPTDTLSKKILLPVNLEVSTSTIPLLTSASAPNALNPFRCKSIGLLPILHPPGSATFAFLYFPSKAPRK